MPKLKSRILYQSFSTLFISTFAFIHFSFASPMTGAEMELKQPNNTFVKVYVWGDEFYQRIESLDGYTLIRDPYTNWITYAEYNLDRSDFVSTDIIYNGQSIEKEPEKQKAIKQKKSIEKNLKLDKEIIKKKAEKVKAQYFADAPLDVQKNFAPDLINSTVKAVASNSSKDPKYSGDITGITILVDFPDKKSSISKEEIENFVNQQGYKNFNNNGSVHDYFYDASGGTLNYTNIVTAFYTAKNPKGYYDNASTGLAKELFEEAIQHLDAQGFDFSRLSTDSNNYVRAVNILYAGSPDWGWSKGLWPHKGYVRNINVDGVTISTYAMSNIGTSLNLDTFCHENGHLVCNWSDLYDYDGDSAGTGNFDLMSGGSDSNPLLPNPYYRNILCGWGSYQILNDMPNNTRITTKANDLNTYVYKNPSNSNELFIIENAGKNGRRTYMPGEGLLIWHIDKNGSNDRQEMTQTQHYMVSIEQADGLFDLEKNANRGNDKDFFKAGTTTVFNDMTNPSAKWWNGNPSGFSISDISATGDLMTFVIHNNNTITPSAVPTPTITPIVPTPTLMVKKGDLDGNGSINSTDFALMRRYLLRIILEFPNNISSSVADLNEDGYVNSTDAAMLKRILLGIT